MCNNCSMHGMAWQNDDVVLWIVLLACSTSDNIIFPDGFLTLHLAGAEVVSDIEHVERSSSILPDDSARIRSLGKYANLQLSFMSSGMWI